MGRPPELSVVIPFFQRTPGVLARALSSVALQRDAPVCEVIVVDDGSPVPADGEVGGLGPPPWLSLRVVTQANAGVAAARNAGLNAVSPHSKGVAFLDSDDEWCPDHLHSAREALVLGADIYAANYIPHGATDARWSWRDLDGLLEPVTVSGCYRFVGDILGEIARGRWIGHTSNLVVRSGLAARVRFQSGLNVGEDVLYVADLVRAGARHAFYSMEPSSRCGDGVNIWASCDWGSEGSTKRLAGQLRYFRLLRDRYVGHDARDIIQARIKAARRDLALAILGDIRRRKGGVLSALKHAFGRSTRY